MLRNRKQAFRNRGFLWRYPAWCEQRKGRLIGPHYIFQINRRPGFMIITPSLSLLELFAVIRCLAIVPVPWMLDLWSSPDWFCGNGVFKINFEFCCHLCYSSSVILDTVLSIVGRSLSLSCGCRPLFLLTDDVFPWFVCVSSYPWKPLLWLHIIKWPVWLQMLRLNVHQQSVLWKSDKSPIVQYLIRTVTKH
jgi:hypothetical protein